jgi:hypothetical protein
MEGLGCKAPHKILDPDFDLILNEDVALNKYPEVLRKIR